MFELGPPPSPDDGLLSSAALNAIQRQNAAQEYQDRLAMINQTEKAAFGLAVQTLVAHGRPMAVERMFGTVEFYALSTGFRMIGESTEIPHLDHPGVVVRAIRLSLGQCTRKIPYRAIRRAQRGKADSAGVADDLAATTRGVVLEGYVLSTHRDDIRTSGADRPWQYLAREVSATGRRSMRRALYGRPDIAMWALPLPEFLQQNQRGGDLSIVKDTRHNLKGITDAAEYAFVAREELRDTEKDEALFALGLEWMQMANGFDRAVSSLGAVAVNPYPAEKDRSKVLAW